MMSEDSTDQKIADDRIAELETRLQQIQHIARLIKPTTKSTEVARGIAVLILGYDENNERDDLVKLIAAILETRYQRRPNDSD